MIATGVELTRYDWIIINSSAGKDSQAMLDFVVEQAKLQGVELSHLVVVHCDLGRVEWKGTKELAEVHLWAINDRSLLVRHHYQEIPSRWCRLYQIHQFH